MYVIGAIVVIALVAVVFTLAFIEIPEKNQDEFNIATGIIGTAFMTVVAFYYGSSAGSKRKTDMMNKGKENEPIG